MNSYKFEDHDPDLDCYFVIRVMTDDGERFVYTPHALVHDMDFAKRFNTRRAAASCVHRGNFTNYEILKFKHEHVLD